jgi:hypothetical protein
MATIMTPSFFAVAISRSASARERIFGAFAPPRRASEGSASSAARAPPK